MSQLNPDDYVITRRRKKYKFAHFANLPNCYEADEWQKDASTANLPLTVELGAGTGLFSLELARRHSERFFVAIDVKADRLYTAARQAHEENIANIAFVRAHADQLPELFAPDSVSEIWLTFSDPFPKKRHAKHRLTHPRFLDIYRNILSPSGVVRQKTDNHALFDWSLEQLVAYKWHISELSYDLHESSLYENYKIMTSYEQRFVREGLPIHYLSAIPKTHK